MLDGKLRINDGQTICLDLFVECYQHPRSVDGILLFIKNKNLIDWTKQRQALNRSSWSKRGTSIACEIEKYINEKIELYAVLRHCVTSKPFSKHSFDKQSTDGFIGYTQV